MKCVCRGVGASGGFGPFSASASFTHGSNEKITKDVFNKWGIDTEFKGGKFVPKSIDTYALNTAKIRQAGTFVVGKRKKTVSDGVLTVSINPRDNVLHSKATPAYEERMALVQRALNDLREPKTLVELSTGTLDVRSENGAVPVKDAKIEFKSTRKAKYLVLFNAAGINRYALPPKDPNALRSELYLSLRVDGKVADVALLQTHDPGDQEHITLSFLGELAPGDHTVELYGRVPGREAYRLGSESTPKLIVAQLD